MSALLDKLLAADLPSVSVTLPSKRIKLRRLAEILGEDACFTIHALPYGKVEDIRGMSEADQEAQIVLAGCLDPDFKNHSLQEHYGAATPVDAIHAVLLPGEIADLAFEIEKLTGFRQKTIVEVKND